MGNIPHDKLPTLGSVFRYLPYVGEASQKNTLNSHICSTCTVKKVLLIWAMAVIEAITKRMRSTREECVGQLDKHA